MELCGKKVLIKCNEMFVENLEVQGRDKTTGLPVTVELVRYIYDIEL